MDPLTPTPPSTDVTGQECGRQQPSGVRHLPSRSLGEGVSNEPPRSRFAHRHQPRLGSVSLLVALVGSLIGTNPTLADSPLHLTFTHHVSDQPLHLDSLRYENAAAETWSATRISYLVSGLTLHAGPDTPAFVSATDGFIDAATSRTRWSLPQIPPGTYSALTFHIGLDKVRNHSDPAKYGADHPLNPNLNKLHWDWQGGYIFLALEGHWRGQGARFPEGYAYHFANDENLTRVTLEGPITIMAETDLAVALDLAKVLDGLSFGKDGATTHSRPGDPVATRLRENLPAGFRLVQVAPTPAAAARSELKPIDLPADPTPYPLTLPRHVPIPGLPRDNPLIVERVALGEKLFSEPKFSRTNTLSCASCHHGPTFSDPRRFSPGVDGLHPNRHSMPLLNLAWKSGFFWDGRASSLREQVLMPIEDHLELDESVEKVVDELQADPAYPPLFEAAFGSGETSSLTISLALENFLLSRLSFDSKFDASLKGQATLTEEEGRGMKLFFTESEPRLGRKGADCFHCHGGSLFSDHGFHNNGLATNDDIGLEVATGRASDRFKFSTPSLRNVSLTAPYMHDGRFATLEEVIEHYNAPVTYTATLDPNLAKHPHGLGLDETDKAALIAFLKTLSPPSE